MLSNPRPGTWAHYAHCHVCHMPACFNVSLAVILPLAPVQPLCKQCLYSAELRMSLLDHSHNLYSISIAGQESWRSCGSWRATKSSALICCTTGEIAVSCSTCFQDHCPAAVEGLPICEWSLRSRVNGKASAYLSLECCLSSLGGRTGIAMVKLRDLTDVPLC